METEQVKPLLDFVIVGVQKAGTTALASFLAAHPQLVVAKGKEVHLFDRQGYVPGEGVEGINDLYRPYFPEVPSFDAELLGEATPFYIFCPEIIAELARYNPALKIIVQLRDPVERALSQYQMECARGNECRPLWQALLLESWRLRGVRPWVFGHSRRSHSYLARGRYAEQLQVLTDNFPDSQILVVDNAELSGWHVLTLARIFEFLGVDSSVEVPQRRVFAGGREVFSPLLMLLMRVYFCRENVKLRRLLAAMPAVVMPVWLRKQ